MLSIGRRNAYVPFRGKASALGAAVCAAWLLAFYGLAPPAQAEGVLGARELVCPRVEVELQDGRVPEEAWEEAAAFELARTVTGDEPEHATFGSIMFDDDHIYVQAVCMAPDRLKPPPELGRNDSRITSQHDHLQLFITPNPSPDTYFRLAADRAANIWDTAYRRDEGAAMGDGWNPDWTLHVDEVDGGWRAEFIIPFDIYDADTPRRGDLWRFKLGRYGVRQGLPATMWPINPTGHFHEEVADGALYFESENLLPGGDFAEAEPGRDAPPHWRVSRPPADEEGDVRVVEDPEAVGGRALHYVKATVEDHRPQVWSIGHDLEEGGMYALSARLRGGIPNMNLRMDTRVEGTRYRRGSGKHPTAQYQRFTFQFDVPRGAGEVGVGFSPGNAVAGVELEGPRQPVRLYAEPEYAIFDLPYSQVQPGFSLGRDRLEASNWFYVYRHPGSDEGRASVEFGVPGEGTYTLWARVRSEDGRSAAWQLELDGESLEAATEAEGWTWVRAGSAELGAGAAEVAFATRDRGAALDLLCLTDDADFEPQGQRPEGETAPASPGGLRAENVRPRTNRLDWDAAGDPLFSHFNVYASREAFEEPAQERLVGSPTEPLFIDWGLRAGTEYHYSVTAVDRRGNESEPAFVQAATPEREREHVELELAFADAELSGPFARSSEADGLRGDAYVVPEDPDENAASWRISVPEDTTAYLWLRYLPGLEPRMSRRVAVRQNIRVSLNGDRLETLDFPTAINVPDNFLTKEGNPLAPHFWTWHAPVRHQLEGVRLPAGDHTLTVSNLATEVRYDVLYITNEPSFQPECGRLRQ